jgi:hypothetical protein
VTESYKTLGQLAPLATTLTELYTVPALTSVVISTLIVCNRGSTSTTFRVSVRVNGEADALKQYIYYDVIIPKNDTFAATLGITLQEDDEVWVYAGNSNLSFQLWGTEITS